MEFEVERETKTDDLVAIMNQPDYMLIKEKNKVLADIVRIMTQKPMVKTTIKKLKKGTLMTIIHDYTESLNQAVSPGQGVNLF